MLINAFFFLIVELRACGQMLQGSVREIRSRALNRNDGKNRQTSQDGAEGGNLKHCHDALVNAPLQLLRLTIVMDSSGF